MLSAFALTNCTQEIDNPAQQPEETGYPFEIVASTVDTKTVNDGMSTKWAEGDQINLFHAVTGSTDYKSNGAFVINDVEAGSFNGNLCEELDVEKEYDWYAFYPYSSYIKTPANTSTGYMTIGSQSLSAQKQSGNNNMDHIAGANYPMWGIATAVSAGDTPAVEMSHLSSLIEVAVYNKSGENLTVNSVSFTGTEDIVGTYYINFSTLSPAFKKSGDTYVSKTANLDVVNGEAIANNNAEPVKFYLAVKPFTAKSNKELVLAVNGYSKVLPLTSDVDFSAGKIKTLKFTYDKVATEGIALPWSEDFSGDISQYSLVNGGTTTKVYESENLAGGSAPELLVSKTNGSFSATIATDGYVGMLTLTFKSNYPERLTVTSPTSGVEVSKESNTEYLINITESTDDFELVFKNTNSSNTRLDDIFLVKGLQQSQTLTFEQPALSFYIGSDEAAAFNGQFVQGAKTTVTYSSNNEEVASVDPETGVVTLKDIEGSATITAVAKATEEYKEARASYLVALSKKSQGGVAKQYTFTITKDDFNSDSYDANNKEKISTATAIDGSTMEVRWTSYKVMKQNSTMQWQKNNGYIYNTTDLGTIDNVEITSTKGTFTKYINSSLQPTSNGTGGYFQIKVGSATGNVTSIVVTFTK